MGGVAGDGSQQQGTAGQVKRRQGAKVKRVPVTSVRILSPAKINLFLEVLGKRRDGYHEIKTVLQAIDLWDELTVHRSSHGILVRSVCQDIPLDNSNLAYQAAQLFLRENKIKYGVEIGLVKRIPVSGGLGGGSSNASCTLLAMDMLFGTHCSTQKLLTWAKKLGSDVPFFIRGEPSLALGRGTEIMSLEAFFSFWVILAGPVTHGLPSKTAGVYKAVNMGLTGRFSPITLTTAAIETKNLSALSNSLFNRLESVVLERSPFVREIRDFMKAHGALGVLVSGAGPMVFGIVPDRAHGVELGKKISRQFGKRVYRVVAKTLASTPAPVEI